jgi:hypothetical protein
MSSHDIIPANILGPGRRLGIDQLQDFPVVAHWRLRSEEFVVRPIEQVSKAFDATVVMAHTSVVELPGASSKAEMTIETHGVVLRVNVASRKISSVLRRLLSGEHQGEHVRIHAMENQVRAAAAERPMVEQANLSFPERFLPSQELLNIWTDCLSELAESAGRKNVRMAIAEASPSERANQFALMFRATIGSYAQHARLERSDGRLMTGGRFVAPFQLAVTDQFYVVPDRASHFLEALAVDFIKSLERGWSVQGEWGRLIFAAAGGDVSMEFNPLQFFEDPDFVESEDVE